MSSTFPGPGSAASAALAWLIALIATVAAVAGWARPGASSEGAAVPVSAPHVAPDAALLDAGSVLEPRRELAALQACVAALRARADLPAALPDAEHGAERVATCLRDPEVRAHVAREVARECGGCGDGSRAAREAEERARSRSAADFLRAELGIDPGEQAQLAQYLCTIRDSRGLLSRATAPGESASSYDSVREVREVVLGDVESILGAERFARLRAVGGLAVLSDAAECDASGEPVAP